MKILPITQVIPEVKEKLLNNNRLVLQAPPGAGKTTVSKLLSQKLGCVYVDTGALYRGVAYEIDRQNIDWENDESLDEVLVSLSSSDTSEAAVPVTVTIAAGQSISPPFDIDAIDDALLDGTQTVTITATAAAHADGTDTVDVTDNDVAGLTLTIAAASVSEGDGAGATTATVSRNTDTTNALTVTLSSDDTSEATVPATVTIPAGQTSVTFDIDAIDDAIVDGTQTVTVTASAAGQTSGSDTLDVTDDDVAALTVAIVLSNIHGRRVRGEVDAAEKDLGVASGAIIARSAE